MTANYSRASHHIITLSGAALFAASSFFVGVGPAAAAWPKPDEDGQAYCTLHDNVGNEDKLVVGPNSCCWEEAANDDGDTIKFCIQCDSEWKNCVETEAISVPRGGGLPKGDGTISEPRPKPGPKLRLDRPRNGEVLR